MIIPIIRTTALLLLFLTLLALTSSKARTRRQSRNEEKRSHHTRPPITRPGLPWSIGPRGVWAYQHGGDATYGTHAIVDSEASRTAAIDAMNAWSVRRFYGSYGDLPTVSHPGRPNVGRWNKALYENGYSSQLLLGAPAHAFAGSEEDGCRDSLLRQISTRLLEFHDSFLVLSPSAPQNFDAVHLDVEVHAMNDVVTCDGVSYAAWDDADGAERARRFYSLYETAVAVREYLDAAGATGPHGDPVRLEMDLPFWIDSSGAIDWAGSGNPTPFDSAAGWFEELAGVVDGVTLMTYHEDDLEMVLDRAEGEAGFMYPTPVRVGLNPAYDEFWGSVEEVLADAMYLDTSTGGSSYRVHAVDFFHYKGMMLL